LLFCGRPGGRAIRVAGSSQDVTPSVLAPAVFKAGSERPATGEETQRLPETICGVLGPVEGVYMRDARGCLGAMFICAAFWVVVVAWSMGWL